VAALDAIRNGNVLIVVTGRDVLNIAMFKRLARRHGGSIVSAAGEGTNANHQNSRLMLACGPSTPLYEAPTDVSALQNAMGASAAPLPALWTGDGGG
jgi:hypothetical protein